MLATALLLALLGFIALIVALSLGSTVWAWICVIIAGIGVVLSIYEWFKYRKEQK